MEVFNWLPQRDQLANERVKLLITHGDYNRIIDVTHLGVPTPVLPLFGDQLGNARRVAKRGLKVFVERYHISEESVTNALRTVLNNHR